MSENSIEQDELWTKFLNIWPITRMEILTLSEYTSIKPDQEDDGSKSSFTRWLEALTEPLGSIRGGASMKFGIYKRKDKTDKESVKQYSYTDEYGWYTKYGKTPEEAFENVKKHLLNIIENVQRKNLIAIDASLLGDVLTWKVAFLYQDRVNPIIMPIYAAKSLRGTHSSFSKKTPLSHCHEFLISEREGMNIFTYAKKFWDKPTKKGEVAINQVTNKTSEQTKGKKYSQNLILYGPPGTGKTWTSSEIAVQICDGDVPDTREALMERYRKLVETGRVAFTTFHQSMGYEEFVEGLRPTTDADDGTEASGTGFRLEPCNGIFRDICDRARQSKSSGQNTEKYDFTGRKFFKMSLGLASTEEHIFDSSIENQCISIGYGGVIDWSEKKYKNYESVKKKWQTLEPNASGNSGNIVQIWCFLGQMKIGDIVVISDGNHKFRAIAEITGDYEFVSTAESNTAVDYLYCHRRSVKWLANLDKSLPAKTISDKNFSQVSCYNLKKSKINLDVMQDLISPEGENEESSKMTSGDNFVLIIDEINRANISKVFGELITLLEPDKRIGAGPNALEVTLPYSGHKFGVPKNLHIVGTMNTADRSIALLDTALRRRFSFQEMMPLYDIEQLDTEVEGVHLGKFLKAINNRIEWMFDRDHQIGHSFLTSVKTLEELETVVREKLIPLLTEYFYEDWAKVCTALNDKEHRFIIKEKLSAPVMESADEEERYRYKVNTKPFLVDAYHAAYKT